MKLEKKIKLINEGKGEKFGEDLLNLDKPGISI